MRKIVSFGNCNAKAMLGVPKLAPANSGLFAESLEFALGADAVNVALGLSHFGLDTHFVGYNDIGTDFAGQFVTSILDASPNLTYSIPVLPETETPFSVNLSTPDGNRQWYSHVPEGFDVTREINISGMSENAIVYADSYYYVVGLTLKTMEDIQPFNPDIYVNIGDLRLIKQNMGDMAPVEKAIAGAKWVQISLHEDENCDDVAEELKSLGAENLILTQGANGATLVSDGTKVSAPAPEIVPVRSAGAGAYFSVGYIYGVAQGWHAESCLKFAVSVGSHYAATHEDISLSNVTKPSEASMAGGSTHERHHRPD